MAIEVVLPRLNSYLFCLVVCFINWINAIVSPVITAICCSVMWLNNSGVITLLAVIINEYVKMVENAHSVLLMLIYFVITCL